MRGETRAKRVRSRLSKRAVNEGKWFRSGGEYILVQRLHSIESAETVGLGGTDHVHLPKKQAQWS